MSNVMEKIIADLVKGAENAQGFLRGGHVGVEVAREPRGREEKLANHAALGAGLGGILLPGLGAPIGAAIGADKGHGLAAAGGSLLGGVGGGALGALGGGGIGALLGALAGNPGAGAGLGAGIGGGLGGLAGLLYGAHKGGEGSAMDKLSMFTMSNPAAAAKSVMPAKPKATPPPIPAAAAKSKAHETSPFKAPPKVGAAHEDGAKAAAARFGVKEAFLPMLGSLVGGAALRGGLGMAARRFGGNAVGRAAQGTLNWANKGGIRGGALDMAGSMAGGALGAQLQGPPQA